MAITTTYATAPDYRFTIDDDTSAISLVQSNDGGIVYCSRTAGTTVTVAPGLAVGWRCTVAVATSVTGTVSLAMGSGVTGHASPALGAAPWSLAPGSFVDIVCVASNVVIVQGGAGAAAASGAVTNVATRAALKAVAAANRVTGQMAMIATDGSLWRFDGASAAAADGADMVTIVPTAGSGRWIRADKEFVLKLPIAFGTADAAVLFTTPAGFCLRPTGMPWWEVVAGFTGGSSSTIGISSTNIHADFTVKGDILGGAAGDAAATLVAGQIPGTYGDAFNDADVSTNTQLVTLHRCIIDEAKTIRFDRITSAFTAGSGNFCWPVSLMVTGAVS